MKNLEPSVITSRPIADSKGGVGTLSNLNAVFILVWGDRSLLCPKICLALHIMQI